jgi:hypothetical protein
LKLGYGSVTGGDLVSGPGLGLGWRFELDKFALEVSLLDLIIATDKVGNSTQSVGVTGSFVELAGMFFTNPVADYTGYFGGGFSWGISHVQESGTSYTGSGLQANAMAGIEMFRSSTMRLFVQADAQLPLYNSTVDFCSFMVNCPKDTRYTPAFWASVGIGWGKANTIGVVQR